MEKLGIDKNFDKRLAHEHIEELQDYLEANYKYVKPVLGDQRNFGFFQRFSGQKKPSQDLAVLYDSASAPSQRERPESAKRLMPHCYFNHVVNARQRELQAQRRRRMEEIMNRRD